MKKEHVLNWEIPIEKYFEIISQIPRESGNEGAVSEYLLAFAKERGLSCRRDDHYNVVIRKDGSEGYKDARPVILQAHTDMVCAKRPSSTHDFTKDPIDMYVKDGILRAKDTSLGSDDGWGVAYILSILDDDSLAHPPLECVFTSEEETGCVGVRNLDMTQFAAKTLISLDGDRDVETYVSCFTSNRLYFEKEYALQPAQSGAFNWKKISIGKMSTNVYQGLMHQECGNSIKSMARMLQMVLDHGISFVIAEARGGTEENFGPEYTEVLVGVDEKQEPSFEKCLRFAFSQMNAEYENKEYCGSLEVHDLAGSAECPAGSDCSFGLKIPERVLSYEDTSNFINFIYLLPNNLFQTGAVSGRLDCVNNVGVISLENGKASVTASDRSRFASAAEELEAHCALTARLTGFTMSLSSRYEGWEYNSSSTIKKLFDRVIREHYGCGIREIVCPGGLEIAYFVKGIPGIDAIEIGVNHDNPHSVDEAMEMHSFHKMYKVLLEVLKEMD